MDEISALFAEGSVFRALPGQRAIVSEVLRGCTQCYNFEIFRVFDSRFIYSL